MEITVGEEERSAVDEAMKYFLSVHKSGTYQDTHEVCGAVRRTLKTKGYNVPDEYVEARWHQFLAEENAIYDIDEKLSIAQSKHRNAVEHWRIAKPQAEKYLKYLLKRSPPPPELDADIVNGILKGDEDEAVKALNCNELAIRFAYAGRAFDFDLSNPQRAGMRRLEDAGIVNQKQFETTIRIEKQGKKPEYRPYTVFYWEPTGRVPEKSSSEEEEYKCYADEKMWDQSNGGKA